jgi:signal transduction histidine kinase
LKRNGLRATVPRHLPYAFIFLVVAAAHALGWLWPLDRLFVDAGFAISKRAASNHLVLVQMDPRSLEEIGVWPWPRSIHARLLDRLTDADVSEIGYDVDFSSRSTPAEDEALAAALSRARSKVILPAFRQRSTAYGGELNFHDTQPLPEFLTHVQLGNVVFRPSTDGLIRDMSVTVPWQGGAVPAMSALLAGPAAFNMGAFSVDFAIDVKTVPRYSLIDVLEGRIPENALKGKKVLVGAAATELGDQHAVPVYGRLHGIELQALAFESLVQGRALHSARPEAVIIGLLMITLMLSARLEVLRWQTSAAIGGVMVLGFTGFVLALQVILPIIIPTTAVILLVTGFVIASAYRDLWANALLIFRQRMNLIHQRAFIQEFMENSFDGLVVTDASGLIVAHNHAAKVLLRAKDEDISGRALNEFLPANEEFLFPGAGSEEIEQQAHDPIVVRFNPHHDHEYYLEFMPGMFHRRVSRRDPSERRLTDRLYCTYTFRDVTDRVTHEISEKLEKERALEQSRAKSEVLASMSHELRTPLNAILGFSEIMKNEVLGPLTDNYRSYADGVHESGKHLLNLIDEMLDVARIDGGQFTLNEALFDVGQALTHCMRIAEGWRETRDRFINLELADDLPQMMGSARLIKQCVINAVSNSIKYSSEGDAVTVRARIDDKGDLLIEVTDTGVGIDPDQIDFVTKPFFRAGGVETRDAKNSVGLGLSLVDAYVRAHGGRLEIFSKPGLGTNVRMIFPEGRLFLADEDLIDDPATVEPSVIFPDGKINFPKLDGGIKADDGERDGDGDGDDAPPRPDNVIDFRNKT